MSKDTPTHVVLAMREGKPFRTFGPFTAGQARYQRTRLVKIAKRDYPGQDITIHAVTCWPTFDGPKGWDEA